MCVNEGSRAVKCFASVSVVVFVLLGDSDRKSEE